MGFIGIENGVVSEDGPAAGDEADKSAGEDDRGRDFPPPVGVTKAAPYQRKQSDQKKDHSQFYVHLKVPTGTIYNLTKIKQFYQTCFFGRASGISDVLSVSGGCGNDVVLTKRGLLMVGIFSIN
jgi:hypothetical protein